MGVEIGVGSSSSESYVGLTYEWNADESPVGREAQDLRCSPGFGKPKAVFERTLKGLFDSD